MCTGKCSRLVGLVLVATALACITANILLFFPNGEGQWTPDHITTQAWLMGGVIGGGLMVSVPDVAGGPSLWGPLEAGLMPALGLLLHLGGLGAFYCLVVSSTRLGDGPWCQTQAWDLSPEEALWELCAKPRPLSSWHIVLFSILLGLSLLEMVAVRHRSGNGPTGTVCGDCRGGCCNAGPVLDSPLPKG
uniref:Uncharacterized protein n=1 Tax=Laticauda laticaudata TaxID=8630 RepID=A0A8C5SJ98_LATLA